MFEPDQTHFGLHLDYVRIWTFLLLHIVSNSNEGFQAWILEDGAEQYPGLATVTATPRQLANEDIEIPSPGAGPYHCIRDPLTLASGHDRSWGLGIMVVSRCLRAWDEVLAGTSTSELAQGISSASRQGFCGLGIPPIRQHIVSSEES